MARRSILLIAGLALVGSCGNEAAKVKRLVQSHRRHPANVWKPAALAQVRGIPIAAITAAITQRLAGKAPANVRDDAWVHTRALYASLGKTPLWLTAEGAPTDRARALTDALFQVSDDALRTDSYPIAALTNSLTELKNTKAPTAAQLADADILLSAVYASLGKDLLVGQISPKTVGQSWHINVSQDDLDSALVTSLKDTLQRGIEEMRPADEDYPLLQKQLARYRTIADSGGWRPIPAGKTLHRGQTDSPERIAALRARLAAEGIATGESTRPVYDSTLANAVGEFQSHHAITVDKTLSPETVAALNVPANYRLGQIAANLERLRWMPRTLGTRYIYVNVPAFHLTAYDSGDKSLDMKVIVGQDYADKATPVFSDSMEEVVFRPYWLITPEIQASEIGPKVAADPGYLDRNDMEYYTDGGKQRIRQRPGPKNSLGFVKFLFPNDYNVYLHDTPNHELFKQDVRAFSHGCIRLEKPAELAQWVLGWDPDRVQDAMMNGKDNNAVRLPKKLPVYITYGTAYVHDGELYFGNDLYHRDEQLVRASAAAAIPNAGTRAELEALRKVTSS